MEKDSRDVHLSDARKKLDCMQPIGNFTWNGGSKCDLRKSLAWDSAFFTSPGVLDPEELFATLNFREEDIAADDEWSNKILPSVAPETERLKRVNEGNARRSLAWDNAFFTNPGVLNAEELSLVNSSYNKTEANKLPEVNGGFSKSVDLSSTLQSSRYSVTSIEIDLFEDMRASVRKSATKFEAASSNVKVEGRQEIQFSKESGAYAARRSKPLLPTGKPKINKHRQRRIEKEPSSLSQLKANCRTNTTQAAPLNKNLTPEYAKPENGSSMFEFGRNNMSALKQHCSPKSPTSGWRRRTADSRLTASDSSFKTAFRCQNRRNVLLSSGKPRCLLSKPNASSALCSSSTDGWLSYPSSLNQTSFPCGARSIDLGTGKGILLDNGSSSSKRPDSDTKTPTKLTTTLSDVTLIDGNRSGLRIPLPKIGFFNTENPLKEKRGLKFDSRAHVANKRRYRSSQKTLPKESPSPLQHRSPISLPSLQNKISCEVGDGKSPRTEDKSGQGRFKSEKGVKITNKNVQKSRKPLRAKEESGFVHENKENVLGFENRVDYLSRDFEAIDLNGDLVIELQMENLKL